MEKDERYILEVRVLAAPMVGTTTMKATEEREGEVEIRAANHQRAASMHTLDMGHDVYVLVIGADVNYEVHGVYEDGDEAMEFARKHLQEQYEECGLDDSAFTLPADPLLALEAWNEFWDDEADMQVSVRTVPYWKKG